MRQHVVQLVFRFFKDVDQTVTRSLDGVSVGINNAFKVNSVEQDSVLSVDIVLAISCLHANNGFEILLICVIPRGGLRKGTWVFQEINDIYVCAFATLLNGLFVSSLIGILLLNGRDNGSVEVLLGNLFPIHVNSSLMQVGQDSDCAGFIHF